MIKVDVIVIGAGSAGLSAAFTAKGFGKEVLLINNGKPGGECTWSGCIPSKAFINQAKEIHTAKKYADFDVDTKQVMQNVRAVIKNVYAGESVEVLEKDGIKFINGYATFKDSHTIKVNDQLITASKIFICTGSKAFVPPIKGFDQIEYLTNETFFLQEDLPKSMIVLGAGAIGCELSQSLTRLGVEVKLVEMADSILPREDKELTNILKDKLAEEGIEIFTSYKAVNAYNEGNHVCLEVEGETNQVIKAEKMLVALGRKASISGLKLENARIDYDNKSVKVNSYMETTAKGVYAMGDVAGPYLFSHMANYQAIKAVQNALLPINSKIYYTHVGWATFTSPELATAGLTEETARAKYGDSIRVYKQSYDELDRAKTIPGSIGVVKIVLDKKGKVLGASILGDRAGELISEVQVVKTLGLNYSKLANVIHPYPTYSEILNKISKRVKVDNIVNNPIVKLFRK
jgi:pyruvate/2-oxoglutarate dehydrogenase complex dihydrolipoamide dehydrogenase (E3) component